MSDLRKYCAVLGFAIDVCGASGNHPLCRECLSGEITGEPLDPERKAKKHCGRCGKAFSPGSNAEKYCQRCRKWAYRDKARAWDRENRGNGSQSAKTGGLIL